VDNQIRPNWARYAGMWAMQFAGIALGVALGKILRRFA
jgi:hypothetical protein